MIDVEGVLTQDMNVKRACKLSLKFLTVKKQKQIKALLQAYRAAVNFYESEWESPRIYPWELSLSVKGPDCYD